MLAAGLAGQPASAGFVDGYTLLEWCVDPKSAFCGGYIAALVDYQDALQATDMPQMRFCLPENQNLGKLRDLVIGSLQFQREPELRKLAASLVVPALVKAFPCR